MRRVELAQEMALDRIREALKARLSAPRFAHSVGVEMTARDMARRFGADEYVCAVAGLLHDCGRDLDEHTLRRMAREAKGSGIDADTPNAVLLHGWAGARIAAIDFGVDDPRVLSAIEHHTTGAPGMSIEDRIVCLADFIEPGRDFPGVSHLRELAGQGVDFALAAALEDSMSYIVSHRGADADPAALARSRALVEEIKKSQEAGEFTVG